MTVFVPPAILQEEDAVFHLPVIAGGGQELVRANRAGIRARDKVPRVGKMHGATFGNYIVITPSAIRILVVWAAGSHSWAVPQ